MRARNRKNPMRQIWNRDHQSAPYLQRFLAPDDPEPIYYFLPGEDTTANVRGATKRMHKEVPEVRVAEKVAGRKLTQKAAKSQIIAHHLP